MNRATLADVVRTAVGDALGPYGGQEWLRTQYRDMPQEYGPSRRVLQVAGHIDLPKLADHVAGQVLAVIEREHPEIVPPEAFEDL